MANSPKRSNPLPNSSFPKWGKQRKNRCGGGETSTSAAAELLGGSDRRSMANNSVESTPRIELEPSRDAKRTAVDGDDNNGITAVREKLIRDLKSQTDRMKDSILKNNNDDEEEEVARPWNLRTRRAKGKASVGAGDEAERDGGARLMNLRSGSDKPEKLKFSVELTKKEIEEDFQKMLGRKPPRRPSRRPKAVQNQMDTLFPGLWLLSVTAESYKVHEDAENAKGSKSGKRRSV